MQRTETTAKITSKPDAVEVFTARCEARAYLFREGELDLHQAVDKLQHDAERDGLVAQLGQDAVQSLMAKAFAAVRERPVLAVVPHPIPEPERAPRAPQSTVEAVMYALRERGAAALQTRGTRQRIAVLSSRQLESVVVRLTRIRGKYPKITDDLLLALAELLDG